MVFSLYIIQNNGFMLIIMIILHMTDIADVADVTDVALPPLMMRITMTDMTVFLFVNMMIMM